MNFIELQKSVIRKNINDSYDDTIRTYKEKLEDVNYFNEIDKISNSHESYSLKGKDFTRFIRTNLQELEDEEFYKTVKEFKLLYEQL